MAADLLGDRDEPAHVAGWVARHWLEYWFEHRHTGVSGHKPEQARRHVRYWLTLSRVVPS